MGVIRAKSLFCEGQQGRPGRHAEQRRHPVGQASPFPLEEHGSLGNMRGPHALLVGAGHQGACWGGGSTSLQGHRHSPCPPDHVNGTFYLPQPRFLTTHPQASHSHCAPNVYGPGPFLLSKLLLYQARAGQRNHILPAGVARTLIFIELTQESRQVDKIGQKKVGERCSMSTTVVCETRGGRSHTRGR